MRSLSSLFPCDLRVLSEKMAHGCSIKYPVRIFEGWKNQPASCHCSYTPFFTPCLGILISYSRTTLSLPIRPCPLLVDAFDKIDTSCRAQRMLVDQGPLNHSSQVSNFMFNLRILQIWPKFLIELIAENSFNTRK